MITKRSLQQEEIAEFNKVVAHFDFNAISEVYFNDKRDFIDSCEYQLLYILGLICLGKDVFELKECVEEHTFREINPPDFEHLKVIFGERFPKINNINWISGSLHESCENILIEIEDALSKLHLYFRLKYSGQYATVN